MATLTTDGRGKKRLQFRTADRRRRTIHLGSVPTRQAMAVKVKVEALVSAQIAGHTADDDTMRWVARLPDRMHQKLAAAALVPPRTGTRLGPFIDEYIASRHDLKPNTLRNLQQAREYLIEFLGADRDMRAVTRGDAEQFRLHLSKTLSENTVRTHCKKARHFWTVAIKRELLDRNPFDELPATVQANPDRFHYVSREVIAAVLGACPDVQWRLIVSLCRFGGLRCPSEVLALRWADVDWERRRVRIPSSKTERHSGGGWRIIPLFPELTPHLEAAFLEASEGSEYVITRYRKANANLRTMLEKIIRRAGLEPWPKLFQNLRSTRETELAEEFPQHVVTKWMGNSEAVAAKHYLQLTDDHFQRATQVSEDKQAEIAPMPRAAESATQNPTQHLHANGGH